MGSFNTMQRVRRCPRASRRGVALVYMAVILVVAIGFVALAVDMGRAYVARAQLQIAADAAAHAGVWEVPTDLPLAWNRATTVAAANQCLGVPVALNATQDIEVGLWNTTNRTFTPLSGTALAQANAMRVTARRIAARGEAVTLPFASVVGQGSADVVVQAVAAAIGGIYLPYGVIGITQVNMQGHPLIDSYDSSAGPYSPASAGSAGGVASNGNISLGGNTTVRGDVHAGPGARLTQAKSVEVTGNTANLTQPMYFPPVDASPYATSNNNSAIPAQYWDNGSLSFEGNAVVDVPAGTYYVHDIDLAGTASLNLLGPVVFYATGNVRLVGTVTGGGQIPANFAINVQGAGTVELFGTTDLYAALYAPQATVTLSGTADYYGGLVAGSLSRIYGTAQIHVDTSLKTIGPRQIQLVH